MDKIIRTLACEKSVTLTVINTTNLVNEAIRIHKTSPQASKILGGLLTCGAFMATLLKVDGGSVSLTVKAAEGDGAVSVSADSNLHVRGYADGTCTQTLKGGSLTVVRQEGFPMPFVGACEIDRDDISYILEEYFQQSEQIPTAVYITVELDENGACSFAGGAIMQLLPEAGEEQVARAGAAIADFASSPFVGDTAENILATYFKDIVDETTATAYPQYMCNCSQTKIRGVLSTLGKAELLKTCAELGEVRVHCHYCNKDYVYDKKLIEEIF